ncbi:MAG: DUF1330 domain-containing protein [Actinomycetota bacterium]|nr:DUF1330 domain-containing protein [Actinomycetota bacterium]
MTAYGVGILKDINVGPAIVEYLEKIDDTLAPYGGTFVIHGGRQDVREGERLGDLIVIAFPDRAAAEAWYESDAYQAILPLRTENASGTVVLIDGVDDDHAATDVLT